MNTFLSSNVPPYWQDALNHLSKDPVMAALITVYPDAVLQSRGDPFHTLLRSIVGQQVSVASADALWAKLERLRVSHEAVLEPAFFDKVEDEALRGCGLSRQKVAYVRNLSDFFTREAITQEQWAAMSDEEVVATITQVKGIGRWCAEMFLMFGLLRPNLFPVDDIGVQRALQKHYGLSDAKPFDKEAARTLAEQWQPYRTVATWFLWRSLDPVVVLY